MATGSVDSLGSGVWLNWLHLNNGKKLWNRVKVNQRNFNCCLIVISQQGVILYNTFVVFTVRFSACRYWTLKFLTITYETLLTIIHWCDCIIDIYETFFMFAPAMKNVGAITEMFSFQKCIQSAYEYFNWADSLYWSVSVSHENFHCQQNRSQVLPYVVDSQVYV